MKEKKKSPKEKKAPPALSPLAVRPDSLRFSFFRVCLGTLLLFMLISGTLILLLSHVGRLGFFLHRPLFLILSAYLMCLAVSAALAVFVNTRVLSPLSRLSEASRRVAEGDFSVRLAQDTSAEELNETFRHFNEMVKALGETGALQSDFITNVSHEFKTPLSAIEGYATLLQDGGLSEEERATLSGRILQSARCLSTLCGDILLLSKLENGQEAPAVSSFRLDELIRSVILEREGEWEKKNLSFDLDEIQDTVIVSSEPLLRQVFSNLIGNAVKFTGTGGKITVRIARTEKELLVSVEDTGCGMDEETLRHIFGKFYQGDTSHKSEGNGLGLALCREILSVCGGSIRAESCPGVGSVFTVFLPAGLDTGTFF